jgi:hypothetical protein
MHSSRPSPTEYAPYFNRYIDLVAEADFIAVLAGQPAEFAALLGALSQQQASFRYAPGKWSVREVVGHVVDAERVFGYRALCVARGEKASLPSFDENAYAAKAGHDACPLHELLEELAHVRRGHIALFEHLDQAAWERTGTVNQNAISVRGLAYIMTGHAQHHAGILKERYAAVLGGQTAKRSSRQHG